MSRLKKDATAFRNGDNFDEKHLSDANAHLVLIGAAFRGEFADYVDDLLEEGITCRAEIFQQKGTDKTTRVVFEKGDRKFYLYFTTDGPGNKWAYQIDQPLGRYDKREFASRIYNALIEPEGTMPEPKGFRVYNTQTGATICYVDMPTRDSVLEYMQQNGCPQPYTVADGRN